MSSIAMDNSVQIEAKINELKQIMQTRKKLNSSSAKLMKTFAGTPNTRFMFGRSKNPFGCTDKRGDEYDHMWNAYKNNSTHPDILKLLRDIMHLKDKHFRYSTIQINAPDRNNVNSVSVWHKDTGNMPGAGSYGFSFGDFECKAEPTTGKVGDLWTRDENGISVIDYRNKPTAFDAQTVEHRTNPEIKGKRWAVLYFTSVKATELDTLLNEKYLVLKDTVEQFPRYLDWVNDIRAKTLEQRKWIKDHKDIYRQVYENRHLRFNHEYQINFDDDYKPIVWKKLNLLVLNLQDTDRGFKKQEYMNKKLKQNGFTNYKFYPAIDGFDLRDHFCYQRDDGEYFIDQTKFKSPFNAEKRHDNPEGGWKSTNQILREIGCALGHLKIWQYAYDNNYHNLMVMEDDIDFDNDVFEWDTLKVLNDIEYVNMGWSGKKAEQRKHYQDKAQYPWGHFINYDTNNHIVETHCYIITSRDALKKLIDLYKPYTPGNLQITANMVKPTSHAIDIVANTVLFPNIKLCLLKHTITQMPDRGMFKSQIRSKDIKEHVWADETKEQVADDETKEQVADDETKGENVSLSISPELPAGDSLVTAMDDLWDSEPTEYIHIGFIVDDTKQLGGWRSMTAHLYHCLKYYYDEKLINIKPIVVRTHGRYKTTNMDKNFGYGITTVGMSLDDLAKQKHVLIMCMIANGKVYKNGRVTGNGLGYSDLAKFKGHSIVVHDVNEIPRYEPYLKDMKVFVIREIMKTKLNQIGIKSKYLKHPFYQFPLYSKEKTQIISTARIDGRKHPEIIMEANHLASGCILDTHLNPISYNGGQVIDDGIIRVRSGHSPMTNMVKDNFTEDQKKQYEACYEGPFDMTFDATAKTYADAIAVVDMSRFAKGDGGGTQYTFLEAIYCGCILIVNHEWLTWPGPFENLVNCIAIANPQELASQAIGWKFMFEEQDIGNGRNMKEFLYKRLTENASKLLSQHDNGHLWMNNILKSKEEFYPKKRLIIRQKVAVQAKLPFIKDLFNAMPILEPHFHGWLGHGNKRFLKQCVEDTSIKVIVELGSWYGKSAQYMMKTATHDLTLICVDIWSSKDIKAGNQVIKNETFGEMVGEHPLYENFISNLWDYADKVIPIKDSTINGLKLIHEKGIKPDVVYIDANHTYNDVKAEITLTNELFPFAIICGDDWNWSGVEKAVKEMAETLQVEIKRDQNFWRLETRVNTEEAVEEELPKPEVAVEEELPKPEVAVEEELPTGDVEIIADNNNNIVKPKKKLKVIKKAAQTIQYGIQDLRCAPNDMWGTPPEFKKEHGYDETWFDPCPYPPAEWDATEVDWFKFKDCRKNGNKFFVNPPYEQKFRVSFLKKIVETFNEAKEKNLDIKIHVLLPLTASQYMKPFDEAATSEKKVRKRPWFINLHTGISPGGFPKDLSILMYEHTKVLAPINHTNDDIEVVDEEEEEDDHELEFDPMKCYVGAFGSVKQSNKKSDFDYEHYQKLKGLKNKKSEIKPEPVNVKKDPIPLDLGELRLEREQRRGVPSKKASSMANNNNNNNRIIKYDDIGKKKKKKKKTSWRSLGKGESLKGNVVEADPIIGQMILWKGDDGKDYEGKIVSYTRRKYEIAFEEFEDRLVSKSAAQQMIQFYKDKNNDDDDEYELVSSEDEGDY